MNNAKPIIFYIFITLFLYSCLKKEEFKKVDIQEINPGWGVPILDSKLALKDIVPKIDSSIGIIEESDKTYTLYYYDTIKSPVAEEIFQIADQNFSKVFPSPVSAAIPFPAGQEVLSEFTHKENFDVGNESSLKYILLKDGRLQINISSSFQHGISIELTLHSLLDKNLNPVVRKYDISTAKPSISDIINLQDYKIQLSEKAGETNAFKYSANYKITSTGQALNNSDGIFVSLNLLNLKYKLIAGDIGTLNFPQYNGKLSLPIFDPTSFGNIYFSEAKLNLAFENSLGIPINFTINKLRSTTSYNKEVDITPTAPPLNILLKAPMLSDLGKSVRSGFVLDKTNSRIVEAINPAPNKVEYDFISQVVSGTDNFLFDKSQIKVFARMDIPLKGSISSYELKDTVPIGKFPIRTFAESGASGSVDSISFKLKIENSVPANVFTQLYFLDSTFKVIDSLLIKPDYIIASNNVNPSNGEVISPTIKETVINFTGKRYDRVREYGKHIYISGKFNTSVDPATGKPINITLQSSNALRVVISVLTKGRIKIQ